MSEAEDLAQSAVDLVHQRCRELADRGVEVSLVEGYQGGDVDDRVFGQAGGGGWDEYVAGHGRKSCAGGAFLASDDAAWITGVVLDVTGGAVMP